jgi:hypothetical protein
VIRGADALATGLRDVLGDLSAADRAVGARLTADSRSRAPVRTGKLRGSLRAVQAAVTSDLVYAAPIHWGWRKRNIEPNRFAWDTAKREEWVDVYAQEIQRKLSEL